MRPDTMPSPTFLRGHWSTEGGGEPMLVLTWMEGGKTMSAWVPQATYDAVVAYDKQVTRQRTMMTEEVENV